MPNSNQHGLSRYIPQDVAYQVRKRCGFGCVICGNSLIEYEHFDPEFKDAKEHAASGITILRGDCHGKKTRKFYSNEKVRLADQNPYAIRNRIYRNEISSIIGNPSVRIGPVSLYAGSAFVTFVDLHRDDFDFLRRNSRYNLIQRFVMPVLHVLPPEEDGAPFRVFAMFFDSNSNLILSITDNQYEGDSSVFDVEFVGGIATIKDKFGSIALQIDHTNPNIISIPFIECSTPFGSLKVTPDRADAIGGNGSLISLSGGYIQQVTCGRDFVAL